MEESARCSIRERASATIFKDPLLYLMVYSYPEVWPSNTAAPTSELVGSSIPLGFNGL